MSVSLPADLRIVRHKQARRMKLRIDRRDGAPVLVLPPRASQRAGEAFVRDHLDWIRERQAARPAARPFVDGIEISVAGQALTIRHRPDLRLGARRRGSELLVSGEARHLNRRVVDWLSREARQVLSTRARDHAARLGATVRQVRIADQISRWGSCSARSVLSFNWRLILAPEHVLDFVAAHEAAHLVEMNHGPAFHRLVARLHSDPARAEDWLKTHGPSLRAWGREPENVHSD